MSKRSATDPADTQTTTAPDGAVPVVRAVRRVEDLAREAGTQAWALAATIAFHRWPIGMETTREEFDRAVAEANGGAIR